jgi:glycosyltransferase involved in cell wall biosynthesis
VSNNNSNDHTQQVIEEWREVLRLKVVTQSTNIGGTLNIIEVSKEATGRWIQIIGDDDELIPEAFNNLLNLLRSSSSETWVLVGIANKNGDEVLLGNLLKGSYSTSLFRKKILQTGMYRYGFIGMHVIPSSWLPTYHNLSAQAAQTWPHLALLLRYVGSNEAVMVSTNPVVKQATGSSVLFWKAGDWGRVNLRKINIISAAGKESDAMRWFYHLLVLREFYSIRNIKELVLWKTLEPSDFNRTAIVEYTSRYLLLGGFAIFATLHYVLFLLVWGAPTQVLRFVLRRLGRGGLISEYMRLKETMARFDGIARGL